MDEKKEGLAGSLSSRFESHRSHLRAVAYRMLGSPSEADDVVQEAWLRLSRAEPGTVENLRSWLTTVVARVCLDVLRSRKSRREQPLEPQGAEPGTGATGATGPAEAPSPEHEALRADSVGLALLVVLERLTPAERVAFVLHDLFDLPFDEIAPIVGRAPEAARQLASRARQKVQQREPMPDPDRSREREVVDAFLAASRSGNLDALLKVLAPDVVFRADQRAVRLGASAELRGAGAVAGAFLGRAQAARPALVDGALGIVVAPKGRLLLVLGLTMADGKILTIDAIADPEQLPQIELETLGG